MKKQIEEQKQAQDTNSSEKTEVETKVEDKKAAESKKTETKKAEDKAEKTKVNTEKKQVQAKENLEQKENEVKADTEVEKVDKEINTEKSEAKEKVKTEQKDNETTKAERKEAKAKEKAAQKEAKAKEKAAEEKRQNNIKNEGASEEFADMDTKEIYDKAISEKDPEMREIYYKESVRRTNFRSMQATNKANNEKLGQYAELAGGVLSAVGGLLADDKENSTEDKKQLRKFFNMSDYAKELERKRKRRVESISSMYRTR